MKEFKRAFGSVARSASLASPLPSHPIVLTSVPPLAARGSWFTASKSLNLAYFASKPDPVVPLEHTSATSFARLDVPLSYYLSYLDAPPPSTSKDSLYLAQFDPPDYMKADLPFPIAALPRNAKLSHSSIWLGLAPTTTPLHCDPDDNLLHQLRGRKRVRLLPPDRGQEVLSRFKKGGVGNLRGEEMMRPGPEGERDGLEDAVWNHENDDGVEAVLEEGDTLFIPRKWWHAVRGEALASQDRLNASVNWWFR